MIQRGHRKMVGVGVKGPREKCQQRIVIPLL